MLATHCWIYKRNHLNCVLNTCHLNTCHLKYVRPSCFSPAIVVIAGQRSLKSDMKFILYPVIATVLFFASAAIASPTTDQWNGATTAERRSSDSNLNLGHWHGVTEANVPATREGWVLVSSLSSAGFDYTNRLMRGRSATVAVHPFSVYNPHMFWPSAQIHFNS